MESDATDIHHTPMDPKTKPFVLIASVCASILIIYLIGIFVKEIKPGNPKKVAEEMIKTVPVSESTNEEEVPLSTSEYNLYQDSDNSTSNTHRFSVLPAENYRRYASFPLNLSIFENGKYYDTNTSIYWELDTTNSSGNHITALNFHGFQSVNNKPFEFRNQYGFNLSNFRGDKCTLHTFVDSSNTMFLLCESSIDERVANYMLYVFTQSSTSDKYSLEFVNRSTNKSLGLITTHSFQAKTCVGNNAYTIAQVKPDTYYLFYDDKFAKIQRVGEGFEIGKPLNIFDTSLSTFGGCHPKPLLTPNGRFVVMTGVENTIVIDSFDDSIYEVDKSCTKNTEGYAGEYYNSTIDFTQGAYKTISPSTEVDEDDVFTQSYCSGGCCSQEGSIRIYRSQDKIYCDINIEHKLLGC